MNHGLTHSVVKTTPSPSPIVKSILTPVPLERNYGKTDVSQLDFFDHLNSLENSLSTLAAHQLFEAQKRLLKLVERSIELSRKSSE